MHAERDIKFMRQAIAQAKAAQANREVPIGAVLVHHDDVIAQGHNRTLSDNDPTAHAEIVVLREAALKQANPRLLGTTLYVTVEPCVMCVGALVQARIQRLVYGAREEKTGAVASAFEVLMSDRHNHRVSITEGVLSEECVALLQTFFKPLR